MSLLEFWFLVAAIFLYVLAFVAGFIRYKSIATASLLFSGLLFQLSSASIRWYDIGHPPIFGTYEAALAASWFLLLFIALSYRSIYGHFALLVKTSVPMAVAIVIYGLTFNTEQIPLTISEKSLWVDFHALFSWLAFAPFTLAFCLSMYFLFKSRGGQEGEGEVYDVFEISTPNLEIIDELVFRYVNFGFVMHTIMFSLGCYYSSILYGKWWVWDPAESTSLVTWLSVGLYIHMRLFYNWKGRRAAWLFVVIFVTVTFSYWGLIYMPPGSTFHVFDIGLKAH